MAYGRLCIGTVGPKVTLPAPDEMATNLGVGVLSFRSGYDALNNASTPSAFTYA
jgi:hypothetical protein